MFCPACRDEYRPGFTRCATCDVDLVEDLAAATTARPAERPVARPRTPVRLSDFCGYFSLDEAREARDRLREAGIAAEIVIRDSQDGADVEEHWVRADATRLAEVERLLEGPPEPPEDGEFACGACGHRVPEQATACPSCGAAFEED